MVVVNIRYQSLTKGRFQKQSFLKTIFLKSRFFRRSQNNTIIFQKSENQPSDPSYDYMNMNMNMRHSNCAVQTDPFHLISDLITY